MRIHNETLVFDLSGKVGHANANLTLDFQRTLRLPDNDETHRLPPGLGAFPLREVDRYKDRVPPEWNKHGGIFLPMYQAEALYIAFKAGYAGDRRAHYPFAIKVAAGMRSAVTGEEWSAGLREKDYMVAPKQPWIDGFCVEKGKIRQFVAAPLGQGWTVESQLSGKESFGGLQIEVFPMKREVYEARFPVMAQTFRGFTRSRKGGGTGQSFEGGITTISESSGGMTVNYSAFESSTVPIGCAWGENVTKGAIALSDYTLDTRLNCDMERGTEETSAFMLASLNVDMGMAAGGQMTQAIEEDEFGLDVWDTENSERVYVHLCNSLGYQIVTGEKPPYTPTPASVYGKYGVRWFEHYQENSKALEGSVLLANLQTLTELGFQKGWHLITDNQRLSPGASAPVATKPEGIRDGSWLSLA